jgi:hypothetical protein
MVKEPGVLLMPLMEFMPMEPLMLFLRLSKEFFIGMAVPKMPPPPPPPPPDPIGVAEDCPGWLGGLMFPPELPPPPLLVPEEPAAPWFAA